MAEVARLPSPTNSPAAADCTAILGLSAQTASMAGLADNVSKTGQRVKRTLFVDNDKISARTASLFASQADPDQSAAKRRCCHSKRFASNAAASCTTNSRSKCCGSSSCHKAPPQGPEAAVSAAATQVVQEHEQQAEQFQRQQQQQPKGLTSPLKLRFKLIKIEAGTIVSWCNAAAGCNNNSSTDISSSCCAAAAGTELSADTCCRESTSGAAATANSTVTEQQQQQCSKASARRASLAVVRGYITKHRNGILARKRLQQVLSNSAVAEQLAFASNNLQQQQQQQEPVQDADVLIYTAAAPQADIYVSQCTVCHKECNEFDDNEHDCQHCGAHWGLKQLQTAKQQQCVIKWVADRIMDKKRGYAGQHGGQKIVVLSCSRGKLRGRCRPSLG